MKKGVNNLIIINNNLKIIVYLIVLLDFENRKFPTTFEKAEAFTEIFAQISRGEGLSPKRKKLQGK